MRCECQYHEGSDPDTSWNLRDDPLAESVTRMEVLKPIFRLTLSGKSEAHSTIASAEGRASSCVRAIPLWLLWTRLVKEYSRRRLTHSKDRLWALSGMAQHFAGTMGECLAGIWSADLPYSLLWQRSSHQGAEKAPYDKTI